MKVGLMQNVNTIKALSNKWEILNFKQVLKDSSGGNIKIKTKDTLNEGVLPVVDQGKDFVCGYTNNVLAKVKANLPLIVFGDHTRNLKYIDFDFAMGADGTKILEVICPDALPRFIYYYLTSIEIVNTGYNRHFKFIKDLVFPLPPLSTQKHIAEILDKAAALRDKTKQLLAEYDELAQSIFLDMFGDPVMNPKGWNIAKFKDVLEIRNGKNQKKVLNPKGRYPIYGSGGIMDYADHFISNENSVIIGRKGNINNPILVREKFWHVDTAFGLNPIREKLDYNYLYYFCVRYNFEQHNKTVTIPSLTKSTLHEIKIPVPPIKLQNEFAEKIALIEQQKDLAKQELQESEDLFQALLQKAFKGELVD